MFLSPIYLEYMSEGDFFMEKTDNVQFEIYHDIRNRTNGEIYLGVTGPVRTGKSTFIKRFMELLVLPYMEDENQKLRAVDELPQSAQGKTIMTTEPKFVPHRRQALKGNLRKSYRSPCQML